MGKKSWAATLGAVGLIGGPVGVMVGGMAGLMIGDALEKRKARQIPGGDLLFRDEAKRLGALPAAAAVASLQTTRFASSVIPEEFSEVEQLIEKRDDQAAAQRMQDMVKRWRTLLAHNEAAFNYGVGRVHQQKLEMVAAVKAVQSRSGIRVAESDIAKRQSSYRFSNTFVYPRFAEAANLNIARQLSGVNAQTGRAIGQGDAVTALALIAVTVVGGAIMHSRNKRLLEETLGKVRVFHAEVTSVMVSASAGMEELVRLSSMYQETMVGLQSSNRDKLALYVAQGLALSRVKGIAA
jgi:hypothetical protein